MKSIIAILLMMMTISCSDMMQDEICTCEGEPGPKGDPGPMGPAGINTGESELFGGSASTLHWVVRDKDGYKLNVFTIPWVSPIRGREHIKSKYAFLTQEDRLSDADCFADGYFGVNSTPLIFSLKTGKQVDCLVENTLFYTDGYFADDRCEIKISYWDSLSSVINVRGKLYGTYGKPDYIQLSDIYEINDDGECTERREPTPSDFWIIRELPLEYADKYADRAPLTIALEY